MLLFGTFLVRPSLITPLKTSAGHDSQGYIRHKLPAKYRNQIQPCCVFSQSKTIELFMQ